MRGRARFVCSVKQTTRPIRHVLTARRVDIMVKTTRSRAICKPCAVGKYAQYDRMPGCSDCPAGTIATKTGAAQCTPCTKGRYSTSTTVCSQCDPGYYSDGTGRSYCKACSPGKFSGAGYATCSNCPAGRYQDHGAKGSCTICPAGRFNAAAGPHTTCELCEAGKTSSSDGKSCVSCQPGTYAATDGSPKCLQCPNGKTHNIVGAQGCESCPAGKHSGGVGNTECIDCEAGKHSEPGAHSASTAPLESTKTKQASTLYRLCGWSTPTPINMCRCSPGTYADVQIPCLCAAGTYSSDPSTVTCKIALWVDLQIYLYDAMYAMPYRKICARDWLMSATSARLASTRRNRRNLVQDM